MAVVGEHTGQGGAQIGGQATVGFVHGSGQVDADLEILVDWDNDGDFDQGVEDIAGRVMELESVAGRDWASQVTGNSAPGTLRFTVLNTDDRFSFFNADSPLNEAPFSLNIGRKVRVQTAGTTNPDPALLARDRFRGTGALGSDEMGNTWTEAFFPFERTTDSAGHTLAAPTQQGTLAIHIATVDVGTDDVFVQGRLRAVDGDVNAARVAYRFEDTDNYGFVGVNDWWLILGEVNGGTTTVTHQIPVNRQDDFSIGVHADGTEAVAYLDGAPMFTDDAFSGTGTEVGIVSLWGEDRGPSWREFYCWDGLPAEQEGVLWTGEVASIRPLVPAPGAVKTAVIEARGVLSLAADQDVPPPSSVGESVTTIAPLAGPMIGHALSDVGLIHPPGPLDVGTLDLGAVGLERGRCLEIVRGFEDTELGFIFETNEGYVGFEERGARLDRPVTAVFSDATGAQFGFMSVELSDWRDEIINRAAPEITPTLAEIPVMYTRIGSTASGVASDITAPLPRAQDGVVPGDLVVVAVASTVGATGVNWEKPTDWTEHRDARDALGHLRIYSKVLTEADISDTSSTGTVNLYFDTTPAGGAWISRTYVYTNWYGTIADGLLVGDVSGHYANVDAATTGQNNPQPLFPPWGPAPSTFTTVRSGAGSASGMFVANVDDDTSPNGYGSTDSREQDGDVDGFDVAIQWAHRLGAVTVEDPSPWATGSSNFGGFSIVETVTWAVRGNQGSPPPQQGNQIVVVDDTDSQQRHRIIRSAPNPGRFFATEADAQDWATSLFETYATDRPIFTITFPAHAGAAYRAQAIRRRIGHKIRLVTTGASGLGVAGVYYIENIRHHVTRGGKVWNVTWQLSPA